MIRLADVSVHGHIETNHKPFDKPPVGVTIHYTAGGSAISTIDYLRKTAFRYHLIVDRDGVVFQMVDLGCKVNHAGVATWNLASPNSQHVAVAVANWGIVTPSKGSYHTWANTVLSPQEIAIRPYNARLGFSPWEKCGPEQEGSLLYVVRWLIAKFGMNTVNICGHDEAAPDRKIDPGGTLSFSMAELRETLAKTG